MVSVTQIHGGNVGNIVPGKVWLQGTCRFFASGLSAHCEKKIGEIASGIAAAHGVAAPARLPERLPAAGQHGRRHRRAPIAAATAVVGAENVVTEFSPSLGCEDFAFLVRAATGCYAWVGAGEVGPGEGLHGDRFVFNDAIVPTVLRVLPEARRDDPR